VTFGQDGSKKSRQKHVDHGVTDKRKLYEETEFGLVLTKIKGDNSLSGGLRKCWDTGDLETSSKGHPQIATGAHISVIGHITPDELRKEITDVSFSNGLINRFPCFYVHRPKLVSRPPRLEELPLNDLVTALSLAFQEAFKGPRMTFSTEAGEYWDSFYFKTERLLESYIGLVASMVARAAPHIFRFAMILALLQGSHFIEVEHVKAAEALWQMCEKTAWHIFGDAVGEWVADTILRTLRQPENREGLTIEEFTSGVFSKNLKPGAFDRATALLIQADLIESAKRKTEGRGRPATVFKAKPKDSPQQEMANLAIALREIAEPPLPEPPPHMEEQAPPPDDVNEMEFEAN
jgi:hypothetical protein